MKNTRFLLKELDKIETEIKSDSRYNAPTATIFNNAPLALIQQAMEAKISLIQHLREIIES